MSVRSVNVRYSANVSSLVTSLNAAATANDRLATSSTRAGSAIDAKKIALGGLVVGLGAAVAKFSEFDSAMSAVAAATGSTGAELDALRNTAIEAGKSTKYSASDAAQGITELAKAGVSASDIINGGLVGALNLAAAGNLEVGDAAETAATAMTQFKLSGKDVAHIADLLAAGANKAQGGVGDLGMALKQSGLVASQVGLTIEETTAGLTAFAAAGLIGSDAGTSFKTMLQRMTPQSKEAQKEMERLGISAYDSSGNFIGLSNFAGNLRNSLKDLTPEQRNASLAIIFGSDAVRAASVLYSNGAEGIQKWTQEVNESGYAAQQAATLNDNLRGDLTKLGSTFESVLIDKGSAANDTLRLVAQTARSLVEAIGAIPGPVMLGAAAFGVLALVGPKIGRLAAQVTGPLTSGMARFRDEMRLQQAMATATTTHYQRLGVSATVAGEQVSRASVMMAAASRVTGGMKGALGGVVGLLGGPWGIALTGATFAISAWAKAQQDAKQDADDLTNTIDKQAGAWTDASREIVANKIRFDVNPEDLDRLKQAGVDLGALSDEVLAGGPAFDARIEQLQGMADKSGALGVAAHGLQLTLLRERDAAVESYGQWNANKELLGDTADQANAAGGEVDELAQAEQSAAQAAAQAAQEQAEMNAALADLYDVALSARGAARDLEAAIDDASDAIDKNGKTANKAGTELKINTAAGRENQAALDGIAAAAVKSADAQLKNGGSVADVTKKMATARESFIQTAIKMGLNEKAANALADELGLTSTQVQRLNDKINQTPKGHTTNMQVNTGAALQALSTLQGAIAGVHDKTVTVSAVFKTYGYQAALRAQQAMRNSDVYFGRAHGGIVQAFAGGGLLGDVANAHKAEIVPAGAYRVFGEPETMGEAYTPLANDWRRPRAKAITEEVVRRFGGSVQWNAAGSINAPAFDYGRLASAVGAGGRSLSDADVAAIAAAVRDGSFEGTVAGGTRVASVARQQTRQREGTRG